MDLQSVKKLQEQAERRKAKAIERVTADYKRDMEAINRVLELLQEEPSPQKNGSSRRGTIIEAIKRIVQELEHEQEFHMRELQKWIVQNNPHLEPLRRATVSMALRRLKAAGKVMSRKVARGNKKVTLYRRPKTIVIEKP